MGARNVIKHRSCLSNNDCQNENLDSFCVHPFSSDNITRLLRITHDQGPTILFVGSITEISQTSMIAKKRRRRSDFFYIFLFS